MLILIASPVEDGTLQGKWVLAVQSEVIEI